MALFWGVKGVFDITGKINKKNLKKEKKVIFMGTPEFAVPSLEALIQEKFNVIAVYTQPDRQAGRGLKKVASAVKERAQFYGIPVAQPETLKDAAVHQKLQEMSPDLIVVAAYGRMIPAELLKLPEYGCVNIHPSLLPKYRGPSPVASAILNGENITGVSIMLLDSGMDSGPVISQKEVSIKKDDTNGTLTAVLADIGAKLLIETLMLWLDDRVKPKPQDEKQATFTQTITKKTGRSTGKCPLWYCGDVQEHLIRGPDVIPGGRGKG